MSACIDTIPTSIQKQRTVIVCISYDEAFEWCEENDWVYTDKDGNQFPVKIVERSYSY